jgi:hypothetical protein
VDPEFVGVENHGLDCCVRGLYCYSYELDGGENAFGFGTDWCWGNAMQNRLL